MATQLAELDHRLSKRYIDGPKEDKIHARVTHNPSTISPGETLTVKVPKLTADSVLYPESLELVFDFKLESAGTVDDIPDHLTAAIVDKYELKVNGKDVLTIDKYNHYKIYRELWKSEEDYKNSKARGIQSDAEKKQRHGLETATQPSAKVFGERYWFNLGHFLLNSAFSPQAINNDIEVILKFNSGDYTIKNIHLEYDYIMERNLANDIRSKYSNHSHYIDGVHCSTTKTVDSAAGDFEININASYDSLRGVLILYKDSLNTGYVYKNPNITKLKVDIDGRTNQVYSSDYQPEYAWLSAKTYFDTYKTNHTTFDNFYGNNYCTFIDLRTINNEKAHGTGRSVRDYVKLKFTKEATSSDYKAIVYLIYDKKVLFNNNEIIEVMS
jgi:hypothetical protein